MTHEDITMEMLDSWGTGSFRDWKMDYLLDILTGVYDLEDAREDVLSFFREEE